LFAPSRGTGKNPILRLVIGAPQTPFPQDLGNGCIDRNRLSRSFCLAAFDSLFDDIAGQAKFEVLEIDRRSALYG
jgi:hypothetical protein